jgi:hypothetical protein
MPAKVYWIDEPTILVAEYIGEVTGEDIDSAIAQCEAVLKEHSCHYLVDVLNMKSLPKDIMRMKSLINFINNPLRGWLAFAGHQNMLVKFAAQVMVRNKFRFVNSREEGETFLRDIGKQEVQADEPAETSG